MRALFFLSVAVLLFSCTAGEISHNKDTTDVSGIMRNYDSTVTSTEWRNLQLQKLSVIILPPYDEIANEGISPDVQKYLESAFATDINITLIRFSYKQFLNAAYQNIYDKKYCQPIIDKVNPDIIIMTKLELVSRSGKMSGDKWNIRFRVYNVNNGKQFDSQVKLNGITVKEMPDILSCMQDMLCNEIENQR
jgi:hypothetical protein